MDKYTEKPLKSDVFYDGECSLCQVFVAQIQKSSRSAEFETKDVTKGFLPDRISKEDALNEIYVADENGLHKNANAILKILEAFPQYRHIVTIGRLPVVNHLLRVGYFFISRHRHFFFGPGSKLLWVKFLCVLGLLSGILLSPVMWFGERFFPSVPISHTAILTSPIVDTLTTIGLLTTLVLIFFVSRPQFFIFTFFILAILACFIDQMRLQPWFYQYSFMLLTLGLFSWKKSEAGQIQTITSILRLIIAGIYFYSGLQKLNFTFITEVFPWFVRPLTNYLEPSSDLTVIMIIIATCIPFIEMGIGLGLLSRRFHKVAVSFALLMFVFLIPTIGPLGHSWNFIVWPWNIMMIVFVYLLFWEKGNQHEGLNDFHVIIKQSTLLQKIIVLLFTIMPIFSFVHLWDSYPSFALYSGNTAKGFMTLPKESLYAIPGELQRFSTAHADGSVKLELRSWSFTELGVPIYPQERVYRSVFSSICDTVSDSDQFRLHLQQHHFFMNKSVQIYNCDDV